MVDQYIRQLFRRLINSVWINSVVHGVLCFARDRSGIEPDSPAFERRSVTALNRTGVACRSITVAWTEYILHYRGELRNGDLVKCFKQAVRHANAAAALYISDLEEDRRMSTGRLTRKSVMDRFMEKVLVLGNGCWEWRGGVKLDGYGMFRIENSMRGPHRVSYLLFRGSIRPELEIDHICHDPKKCVSGAECPHRRCVNPDHLTLSTGKENSSSERCNREKAAAFNRSKTHCPHGHEYTLENTRIRKDGHRDCKACGALDNRARAFLRPLGDRGKWNRSKKECAHGHEYTPDNTNIRIRSNGSKSRECRICYKEYEKRRIRESPLRK